MKTRTVQDKCHEAEASAALTWRKSRCVFNGIETRTAIKLTALAVLRGVDGTVTWDETRKIYLVDGYFCGPSVHNVMGWLENQVAAKGVQP